MSETPPQAPVSYDAEFFLDPLCPWCWITSRWVVNVQAERGLDVRWRFISLYLLNKDSESEYAVKYRPATIASFNMLRVLDAVREGEGNDPVGRLYTALGTEIHVHGRREDYVADTAGFVSEALAAARLDAGYVAHLDDDSHDATIREETEIGLERTGGNVGTPIITVGPGTETPRSFFGPVMPQAPKGDEAVALWNAFATLAHSGVAEIKRSVRGDLVFD